MEVYTLTITLPYDDDEIPWSRTIEVREDYTLSRLHRFIQKLVEFDDDHLYEFSIRKNYRSYQREIVNKNIKLNEIYPLKGEKLYYLFDFGDCWLFQIKKQRRNKEAETGVRYPVLIKSSGINPEQYPDYD